MKKLFISLSLVTALLMGTYVQATKQPVTTKKIITQEVGTQTSNDVIFEFQNPHGSTESYEITFDGTIIKNAPEDFEYLHALFFGNFIESQGATPRTTITDVFPEQNVAQMGFKIIEKYYKIRQFQKQSAKHYEQMGIVLPPNLTWPKQEANLIPQCEIIIEKYTSKQVATKNLIDLMFLIEKLQITGLYKTISHILCEKVTLDIILSIHKVKFDIQLKKEIEISLLKKYPTNNFTSNVFEFSLQDVQKIKNLNKAKIRTKQNRITLSPLTLGVHLSDIDNIDIILENILTTEDLVQSSYLNLADNKIKNIEPIRNLNYVSSLNLENNKINDLKALENLIDLKALGLGGNEIKDISPLKNLMLLKILKLQNNPITNFEVLKDLDDLAIITIDTEQLKTESFQDFLKSSSQLKEIHLYTNKNNLPDIEGFSKTTLTNVPTNVHDYFYVVYEKDQLILDQLDQPDQQDQAIVDKTETEQPASIWQTIPASIWQTIHVFFDIINGQDI